MDLKNFENEISKLQPSVEKAVKDDSDPYAAWSKELVVAMSKMTHTVNVTRKALLEKNSYATSVSLNRALLTIHDYLVKYVK